MPRVAKALSALEIKRLKATGMHFVGGVPGLLLQIKNPLNLDPPPSRSWILRTRHGVDRLHIGVGPYPEVGLAEARQEAARLLARRRQGINPVQERKEARSALIAESRKAKTFRECAEAYLLANSNKFSNKKHSKQWQSTLSEYVYPIIGNVLVSSLTHRHILDVLRQNVADRQTKKVVGDFWTVKTETASRVRQRIEKILNYAIVLEYRSAQNPAAWKGHLDAIFPSPAEIKRVEHHPAVHYDQAPDFMSKLRLNSSVSAKALEFLILTAVRSGSVRLATWSEIDLKQKVWTVPAEHTKTKEEHRVPLSPAAITILKNMPRIAGTNLVFPSVRKLKPLSDMALSQLMRGMRERGDLIVDAVPHGFRSSFRDWAAEQTNYPDEIRKAASGHAVGDAVKDAYQRTDLSVVRTFGTASGLD